MIKRIIIALALVLALFGMAACGVSTTTSETKVQVGAGPFEDPAFKDCIAPSTKDNSPTNNKYYGYPTGSERDFDATGQKGADHDPVTVLSRDNAEMAIPITLRFNMVGDCKTLQAFHKSYGERYTAYLSDDGRIQPGWRTVLRKLMFDPMDTTLDEIAKKYTWRQLYNDAAAQNELQNTLTEQIEKIVDANARGHYFENFTILMKKPVPTNEDLKNAVAAEQSAVATAQSAEAKARATKAQAEAETATAKAEAAKKRAEILGYGSFENYNKHEAVDKGLNPYQPTYLVPGTQQQ